MINYYKDVISWFQFAQLVKKILSNLGMNLNPAYIENQLVS